MTFSNPAGSAAAAAAAYVRALLEVLGARDPLEVLDELMPWLDRRICGRAGDARCGAPKRPGKWSVIEVIQHLADSRSRLRLPAPDDADRGPAAAARATTRTLGRDASATATCRSSARSSQLRALRAANSASSDAARPAELERVGLHSERGPESVGHLTAAHGRPTTWCTGGRSTASS